MEDGTANPTKKTPNSPARVKYSTGLSVVKRGSKVNANFDQNNQKDIEEPIIRTELSLS